MSTPGISEWVLIILAVLILFGGRKIPEFMKGLGPGIREFNDAKKHVRKELEDGINETQQKSVNSKPQSTTQPYIISLYITIAFVEFSFYQRLSIFTAKRQIVLRGGR